MRRSVLIHLVALAMIGAVLVVPAGAGTTFSEDFYNGFDGGDISAWGLESGSVDAVEEESPDGDGWIGQITLGPECGAAHLITPLEAPDALSFWIRPEGDTGHPDGLGLWIQGGFDGLHHPNLVLVSVREGALWTTTPGEEPTWRSEIPWGEWIKITLDFHWPDGTFDLLIWDHDELIAEGIPIPDGIVDIGLISAWGCEAEEQILFVDAIQFTSRHTLTGTVVYDGGPLPGVEVFAMTDVGPMHTCTNELGEYAFEGVGAVWVVATGPSVAAGCDNAMFVANPDARRVNQMVPLMPGTADLGDGVELFDDLHLTPLEVLPLPRHKQLLKQAKNALWGCYHDDPGTTWETLSDFDERIDHWLDHRNRRHRISAETADAYRTYVGDLRFIGLGVCPLTDAIIVRGQTDGPEWEALEHEFTEYSLATGTPVHMEWSDQPLWFDEEDAPDVVLVNANRAGDTGFAGERAAEVLVDLSMWLDPGMLAADYGQWMIDFASVDGAVLGMPIQLMPKSLVWYRPDAFALGGYEVPTTLEDLQALSAEMASYGQTPWCNYMHSGGATGWVSTDWLEDLVLGRYGGDIYDQWIVHDIPSNGEELQWAMEQYDTFINTDGWVHDRDAMADVFFSENIWPLLGGECFMHRQGSFFPAFVPMEHWGELDTFHFPASAGGFPEATMGSGRYAAAVSDASHVGSFMAFLASPDFGSHIAAREDLFGWTLPHMGFDATQYADPWRADWSAMTHAAQAADLYRFDASDLMPWEVNIAFWEAMTTFVYGEIGPMDALDWIESAWPQPYIRVNAEHDYIDGWGFDLGTEVLIEVESDTEIVFSTVAPIVMGDDVPWFWINTQDFGFDLLVDHIVWVTNDAMGVTKGHTVRNLTFDIYDIEADLLEGSADPDTEVRLNGGNEFDGFEAFVVAESGVWSIDLMAELGFDLTEDMGAEAAIDDEDGDSTIAWPPEPPPEPNFRANPEADYIEGWNFDAGTEVTIQVTGIGDPFETMRMVYVPDWDPGSTHFDLWIMDEFGIDLLPGHTVTVIGTTATKTLHVQELTFETFDPGISLVAGAAPSGAEVRINGGNDDCGFEAYTTANGSNEWSVTISESEHGCDLTFDMGAEAAIDDDDGDSTFVWSPPLPNIRVNPEANYIEGWNFEAGTEVTIDVTGVGAPFPITRMVVVPHWDPGSTFVELWTMDELGFDLLPGHTVTVTSQDASTTKELLVEDLTFDTFDPGISLVAGTAPSGTEVHIGGGNEGCGFGAQTIADGTDSWSVTISESEHGCDLAYDMGAEAAIYDNEGDSTFVWSPNPPTIAVNPTANHVWGSGFTESAELAVTVHLGTTEVHATSVWTDPNGDFGLDLAFEVDTNHVVTVIGPEASKDVLVQLLTFDVYDPATDAASGTATSGAEVVVYGENMDGWFRVDPPLVAESDAWDATGLVDYWVDGWTSVAIYDDDGDRTVAWSPEPTP